MVEREKERGVERDIYTNLQQLLLILLLLRGKLCPAKVSDHVRFVSNNDGALRGHGQIRALHRQRVLIQANVGVLR